MKKSVFLFIVLTLFILFVNLSSAVVLVINATQTVNYRDGYLIDTSTSSEDSVSINVGDDTVQIFRAFIDFNTSSIPDGSTINSVQLNLTINTAGIFSVNLSSLNQTADSILDVGASGRTVLKNLCLGGVGANWTLRNSNAYSGQSAGTQINVTLNSNATSDVQSYLTRDFFSICIVRTDEGAFDGVEIRFNASESANADYRPKLIVDYTAAADSTNPLVNLLAPLNNSLLQMLGISFNASFTDSGGLLNSTLFVWNSTLDIINQTNRSITGTSNTTNLTVVLPYEGRFYWNYYACDSSNNCAFNNTNYTLLVDTVNPGINFTFPTETNNSYLSRNYILVNVSVTDTNLQNITIRLYNSTRDLIRNNISSGSSYFINYSSLSDGIYYINATVNDTVGNSNNTETRMITLDTLFPGIEYGVGTNNSGVNVSRNWIYVNVSVIEINEANITFNLYNSTGAVNSSVFTNGNRVINWTNLVDGNYSYNVTVVDLANNRNSTSTRTITLDTLNPGIEYGVGTNNSGVNVSRNWIYVNVTVTEINEKNITFFLYNTTGLVNRTEFTNANRTINFTGLVDNLYYYNVTLFDFAGNSNNTETRTVTLDTLRPGVVALIPVNNSGFNTSQIIQISANVTDATSNVSSVIANITYPNGTIQSVTLSASGIKYNNSFTISGLAGLYNISFIAQDYSGNINNTERTNFSVSDVNTPGVTIVSPTAQTYTVNTYLVNITLNEQGYCEYSLDNGGANKTLTNLGSLNVSFNRTETGVGNGNYVLNAYCNDTAGNRNYTANVSFTINVDSGGGGGGGGGGCTSNYVYGEWGLCVNGTQQRIGVDNECHRADKIETQSCNVCVNECTGLGVTCNGDNVETCLLVAGCYKLSIQSCGNLTCSNGACVEEGVEEKKRGITGDINLTKIWTGLKLPEIPIPEIDIPATVVTTTGIIVIGGISWLIWLWLLTLFLPFFLVKLRHYSVSVMDISDKLGMYKEKGMDDLKLYAFLETLEREFGKLVFASNDKGIIRYIVNSGFVEIVLEKPFVIIGHFNKKKDMETFRFALRNALIKNGARKFHIMESAERASIIGAWRAYIRARKSRKELEKVIGGRR